MPVRRPSASTGLGSATTSSTRVHKSNDSHPTFAGASTTQSHSINSIGATATPQQKIVQVLVNRLKNKVRGRYDGRLLIVQLRCPLSSYHAIRV